MESIVFLAWYKQPGRLTRKIDLSVKIERSGQCGVDFSKLVVDTVLTVRKNRGVDVKIL